jgi:hypothetical protein
MTNKRKRGGCVSGTGGSSISSISAGGDEPPEQKGGYPAIEGVGGYGGSDDSDTYDER